MSNKSLKFKDIKQLSDSLKNKNHKKQVGGDATPMPWTNYNQTTFDTQAFNANNYGSLPASAVGTPTAGYGYPQSGGRKSLKKKKANQTGGCGCSGQEGGAFQSLWGTNDPTYNPVMGNPYSQDLVGGELSDYSFDDVAQAVSNATNQAIESVSDYMNRTYKNVKNYTQDDVSTITNYFANMKDDLMDHKQATDRMSRQTGETKAKSSQTLKNMYGGMKKYTHKQLNQAVRAHRQNQTGGNATPMPWEWYNPNGQMMDSMQTSGPSGNSPYLMGGANIAQMIQDDAPLRDLGNRDQVVTPANQRALFEYLYQQYPQLRKNPETANIFENADRDDSYIWSEISDFGLIQALIYIKQRTLNFYDDQYKNKTASAKLKKMFQV